MAAWAVFARQFKKGNALLAKDPRDGAEEWHKATAKSVQDGVVTVAHDGWGPRYNQELAVDLGLMKPQPAHAPAPQPTAGRAKRKNAGAHRRADRQLTKRPKAPDE